MSTKYFIFDFDSTFVTIETLEELAQIVLSKNPQREKILQEIKNITDLGMEGAISFEESLSKRLALFQPTQKSISELTTKLSKYVTPSIQRNKLFFEKFKDQIYIISGGFREYITPLAKQFGIRESHVLANSFIFDVEGNYLGIDETIPLCRKGGKVTAVESLKLNGDVIIIGDGYTDYEIKQAGAAESFFAFVENITRDSVVKKADKVVHNLDELLSFPGIINVV